jgi:hypothetical protein
MAISTAYVNQILPKDTARVAIPGHVIQVVQSSTSTQVSSTSTSDTFTGLTANITPTLSTSKILVLVSQHVYISGDNGIGLQLYRNSNAVFNLGNYAIFAQTAGIAMAHVALNYLDSPSTTSQITYSTYFRSRDSGETVGVQRDSQNTSTITLMEIAQ